MRVYAALFAAVLLAACAPKKPLTYRLVTEGRNQILLSPSVLNVNVTQGVVSIDILKWLPGCDPAGDALSIQAKGRRARVTVNRDALLKQESGWLSRWTAEAEIAGCIATGSGLEVATRILNAIPMDPSAAYRLLHAGDIRKGYIDIGLDDRLQVVSPIMKDGTDPNAPILETSTTTGNDRQINLSVRTTASLLGVETAWYTLQPKPDHIGAAIVPISAERSIQGKVEPAAAPITNYFQFTPGAAFYRMFYKTDPKDNGITEIVIAAPTRAALDRLTDRLIADQSLCQQSDPAMCMVIPRRVAVNPFLVVSVNNKEVKLAIPSSVRLAVYAGQGPRRVEDILPTLKVLKPYKNTLVPIDFDRTHSDIFNLPLMGGESIVW